MPDTDGERTSIGESDGDEFPQKNLALTHRDQHTAFKRAREAVVDDVDAGAIDADQWSGEPTDGEVVRVLAAAYVGDLDYDTSKSR